MFVVGFRHLQGNTGWKKIEIKQNLLKEKTKLKKE